VSIHGQTKLKRHQRIYVNRGMNLGAVKAIGFDMDHTLAAYDRAAFEDLAFRETLKKFVAAGYPEELLELKFDPTVLIRGLLVDMERGNILKVDGHKYVKIAFHGRKRLTKDLRHKLYNAESYKAAELLSVDTFFALSEVQLYTELVDYMNRNPDRIQRTFREVYADLRRFIDLSHADGSIKQEVLANPAKYIRKDKYLAPMLAGLAESGKNLFLLTNSGWEYTNAVMSYLLDEPHGDFAHWRDYFEHVIVGAGKPSFFRGSQPFYEVMTDSGLLKLHSGPLLPGHVYHGGNAILYQRLAGCSGDQILFVGDHIYADIVRSKDTVNWRTLLIVEELAQELPKLEELKDKLDAVKTKLAERELLDEELNHVASRISLNTKQAEKAIKRDPKKAHYLQKETQKLTAKQASLAQELDALDKTIRAMMEEREAAVHPVWGELMKVGLEKSRFAEQVTAYACLYTASVTNMRFYSPFKRFTAAHDTLPHELS